MADDAAVAQTAAQTKPINTFITARLENMDLTPLRCGQRPSGSLRNIAVPFGVSGAPL